MIGNEVTKTVIDTVGFRFASLNALEHLDFLPGAVKCLDLPGIMALCALHQVWVTCVNSLPEVTDAVHNASNAKTLIIINKDASTNPIDWLLK